jgi:twitching motility two-component system response regulator PilH
MSGQKQILIVEDSEEDVVFLSEILEEHGYQYRVARNGKEAMAEMRESLPDLVLLDILMPRKTGLFVYDEMKSDPTLEKIPIIVITGASKVTGVDLQTGRQIPKETDSDEFSRSFGVAVHERLKAVKPDGFIEQPIEPELLVGKIRTLLP